MKINNLLLIVTLLSTQLLLACGGSTDNSDTISLLPNDNMVTENTILQLEASLLTLQGVDLILYFPNDKITNIQWQQTAGESVELLTTTSKVLGFTPSQPGNYTFSVDFNKNDSERLTLTKSIMVEAPSSLITARLAHEVLSGNKVSLRTQLEASISTSLLNWRQVTGPIAVLTPPITAGKSALFFTAPQVNKDTYLSFEASVVIDGTKHSDTVTILVEPALSIQANAYFDTRVAKVFPYKKNSPYKESLTRCVYANTLTSSCTLNELPLIANDIQTADTIPDIDIIMDRVVVSHQWMGDRFKDFLTDNDPHNDIKRLLRATTAIVISYDIRPSYYWAATGAIYLDADNFWLTPQERDTINEAPDFRSDFGNDLQFSMPWRYVKNNNYAYGSIPITVRSNRSQSSGLFRLISLMYHELAHANDFLPSTKWYTFSPATRLLDAALSTNTSSDNLAITLPLKSQEMRDLAQVRFSGSQPNNTQAAYLPTDIQEFFSPDIASDFYAYSSVREDYAMLFEELMMQNRFDVVRDVSISNQPLGENIRASDYIVTWGQRGRMGEVNIRPRVLFSASRVLPEFDSVTALQNVPEPIAMTAGKNWLENLIISPASANKKQAQKQEVKVHQTPIIHTYPYYQKALPKHERQ